MNKRRRKKAWRKMFDGRPCTSNENAALYNGKGDFTKRIVKQLGLDTKEWYQEMTYAVFPKSVR